MWAKLSLRKNCRSSLNIGYKLGIISLNDHFEVYELSI
jgi:hypothetical protein